jgi:sporulation integral membrane protein YtvI
MIKRILTKEGQAVTLETIEKRKRFIINFVYFAILAFIVYFCFKNLIFYIMPFLIGFTFAFILKPLVNLLAEKLRVNRKIVAVTVTILFYAVLGVLIFFLGTKLYLFLKSAVNELPAFYESSLKPAVTSLFSWLESALSKISPSLGGSLNNLQTKWIDSLSGLLTGVSTGALNLLSSVATGIPGFLVSLLVTIISSFFFAADYYVITSFFARQLNDRMRILLFDVKNYLVGTVFKLILSYLCIMTITFAELSVGLLILRVPNAIGVAALIAIVDILPVLGTGAVVIPWSLLALVQQQYTLAVGLIVLYVVITVIRNIIEPKIVGKQVGLHPLATLFCMIVGVKLFGGLGIFILPLFVIILKNLNDTGKIHLFK